MDTSETLPTILTVNLEDTLSFYNNSNTLIDTLKQFGEDVSLYIDDFIKFNNTKTSPSPITERVEVLNSIFNKIDSLPDYIATFWYNTIQTQISQVKQSIIKLNPTTFKDLSDSIGSLASGIGIYTPLNTPFYTYTTDYIRPATYIPNSVRNKIPKTIYANLIICSKQIDTVFKHNLSPTPDEVDTNLIQSSNVGITELPTIYKKSYSSTAHGDNLVTDIDSLTQLNLLQTNVNIAIGLIYNKLYKIINCLKSRNFYNSPRTVDTITFSSITKTDFASEKAISDCFDILQQKIADYNKKLTIESQLK